MDVKATPVNTVIRMSPHLGLFSGFGWIAVLVVANVACVAAADGGLAPEALRRVKAATMFIQVVSEAGNAMMLSEGSGFLVAPGLLATNAHVVGGIDAVGKVVRVVQSSGEPGQVVHRAQVKTVDPDHDLAYVAIEKVMGSTLPRPLVFARAAAVQDGTGIYVAGYPLGSTLALSLDTPSISIGTGSVSGLRRDQEGALVEIQVDADVNPGNSGGPVVIQDGSVVGIATQAAPGAQVGLCQPAQWIADDVAGRLVAVRVLAETGAERGLRLTVAAETVDPLGRISAVSASWPSAVSRGGAPPRSKLQRVGRGRWEAALPSTAVPPAGEAVQILVSAVAGEQAAGAITTSWTAPETQVPNVLTVAQGAPLPSRLALDQHGHLTPWIDGESRSIDIPEPLSQLIGDPLDRLCYAIVNERDEILVLDADDLHRISTIPTAKPSTIACDPLHLYSISRETRQVTVFDRRTRTRIASLLPPTLLGADPPQAVAAADGTGWLVAWGRALVHHKPDGQTRVLLTNSDTNPFRILALDRGRLLLQHVFTSLHDPWLEVLDPGPSGYRGITRESALWDGRGMTQPRGLALRTHNGRRVVQSATIPGLGDPRSLLLSPALDRRLGEIPGRALGQMPGGGPLVSIGWLTADRVQGASVAWYTDPGDGRILRTIMLAAGRPLRVVEEHVNFLGIDDDVILVPAAEQISWVTRDPTRGTISRLTQVRCGPPPADLEEAPSVVGAVTAAAGDPGSVAPPVWLRAGVPVRWQVASPTARVDAPSSYRLETPVPGMTVDPATGAWAWTPPKTARGAHGIRIILTDPNGAGASEVAAWVAIVQ